MDRTTGTYQGFIEDEADFERVKREYLSRHDVAKEEVTDFPRSADQQRQLIKAMFEAARDCSNTYEPSGIQSVKRVQSNAFTDLELELVLWPLLISARSAQEGRCRLPRYVSSRASQYNDYGSFMERFSAIVDALRLSKALVLSLFKDATFIDRLAWRPKHELDLKVANRKVNDDRDARLTVALQVADREGIQKDENGRLVDSNGQFYGNAKKRTAVFEDKLAQPKKRIRAKPRDSRPTGVTETPTQALEDTATAANNYSSLESSQSLVQSEVIPVAAPSTTIPGYGRSGAPGTTSDLFEANPMGTSLMVGENAPDSQEEEEEFVLEDWIYSDHIDSGLDQN
ncbi:hypothetical protein K449DRAFT_435094 [Hypoxylon sp. EC38]|nr:hypothetical protein K449DRAFT_435094 [Hypoxylon sp. EC38]